VRRPNVRVNFRDDRRPMAPLLPIRETSARPIGSS
jgi:hypothetical protein